MVSMDQVSETGGLTPSPRKSGGVSSCAPSANGGVERLLIDSRLSHRR